MQAYFSSGPCSPAFVPITAMIKPVYTMIAKTELNRVIRNKMLIALSSDIFKTRRVMI